MKDTTVMQVSEDYSSYETKQEAEYQEAVEKGFEGTLQDYLSVRDYT